MNEYLALISYKGGVSVPEVLRIRADSLGKAVTKVKEWCREMYEPPKKSNTPGFLEILEDDYRPLIWFDAFLLSKYRDDATVTIEILDPNDISELELPPGKWTGCRKHPPLFS